MSALVRCAALVTSLLTATTAAVSLASPAASSPPQRYVLGLTTTSADARHLDAAFGLTVVRRLPRLDAQVVTVPASVRARLAADPDVAYLEPESTAVPATTPNDPYFRSGAGALSGGEWGSVRVGIPSVWDVGTGSADIVVAVVDSGVVSTQPDLAPVLVPGWNVLTNSNDVSDRSGHGTEVAGVAVAASDNGQGVAGYCWTCRLMPVKVYDSASAQTSDLAAGIVWAADHGARVINVSLTTTTPSNVLASAVSYAQQRGALVVAAAGNGGASTPNYPAALPGVLGVAGTDQSDTLYSYSNYGPWVALAAPGSTVTTLPTGGYGAVGGTSIASPAVAGIAAVLMAARRTATATSVADALRSTTVVVNGAHRPAAGRVDAAAALTALGPAAAPAPTAPVSTAAPTVSGEAVSGSILTASTGTWSGSPTAYAYQWQRCSTGCADLPGASAGTYSVTSADLGATLAVRVTATNATGAADATSAPTAAVTAATTTTTFSSSLTKAVATRTFYVTGGTGAARGTINYTAKCAGLTVSAADGSGTALGSVSGPSGSSVTAVVPAGTSRWTVSGSCRVAFTISVTVPAG